MLQDEGQLSSASSQPCALIDSLAGCHIEGQLALGLGMQHGLVKEISDFSLATG